MDLGSDCELSRPQAADSPTVEAPLPKNRKRERVRVRGRFASDAARSGDGHESQSLAPFAPMVTSTLDAMGHVGVDDLGDVGLGDVSLSFNFTVIDKTLF